MLQNDMSAEEALEALVKALQDTQLDLELEAGMDGEGPVAQALVALGKDNIYAVGPEVFVEDLYGHGIDVV